MTVTYTQEYIMGGLTDPNEVASLGENFAAFEQNLSTELAKRASEEKLLSGTGLDRVTWYYYDRALILYRQAYRTGDTAMLERAHKAVIKYRDVLKPKYDYPLNWSFARGVAMHYLLTGDAETLNCLTTMTVNCYAPYYMDYLDGRAPDADNPEGTDNRIQAYVLTHYAVMHAIGMLDVENPWENPATTTEMAKLSLDKILKSQGSGGNFAAKTKQKSPFMTGLLLEALILYWNLVEQDERIPIAIQSGTQFMWDNYRHNAGDTFVYDPGEYDPTDDNFAATYDLNLLTCPAMGWLGGPRALEEWVEQGDVIFEAGVESEAHAGDAKHFNQQYFLAPEYTEWRLETEAVPEPGPEPEPDGEYNVGDMVRQPQTPCFEGQITALFERLDGTPSAVVEAVDPGFEGSQRIVRIDKLEKLD